MEVELAEVRKSIHSLLQQAFTVTRISYFSYRPPRLRSRSNAIPLPPLRASGLASSPGRLPRRAEGVPGEMGLDPSKRLDP